MIELRHDQLEFAFPEVHPQARLRVHFQRTLRVPDDGRTYPLPTGLGRFPLRHVDDHGSQVPASWLRHGGVMLPMYQAEALWLHFSSTTVPGQWVPYPFAVKVATGKINAVSGEGWREGLHREPQDYVVAPRQPWLDGYCVERGVIRQFVAMPLGSGYSAEEQVTGEATHGGLQVAVYPMKREAFEARFPERPEPPGRSYFCFRFCRLSGPAMGLAPGGRMQQEICEDPYDPADWKVDDSSRCFVHIANSLVWRTITGEPPPTVPFTAKEYRKSGLPWFKYYGEGSALGGSSILKALKSIVGLASERQENPLPENESVEPVPVVHLRAGLQEGQVREGAF